METKSFFDKQKKQSQVKATIVSNYFITWAQIILSSTKENIAYIDLFAGPGRYSDGSDSTPLMVLSKAIRNENIRKKIVTIFNDKDKNCVQTLEKTIDKLPGIEKLKHRPQVINNDVGEKIVKKFEEMRLIPTLFFIDPWGYKGLSLRLVNSALKDWGSDCIFFFNYNRIKMGLNNPKVQKPMYALFGKKRAEYLKAMLVKQPQDTHEMLIIEELCKALKSYGSRYTLSFRFINAQRQRTSHHLIFISKHFRGYDKMKGIMAKESSNHIHGVPSFEYNPADYLPKQTTIFPDSNPIDDLQDSLLHTFSGKKLTREEIYRQHTLDTPYIRPNYTDALKELEIKAKISTE